MNLLLQIALRLSIWLSIILGCWAIFFYFAIMDEVNDEINDMLEDYSEQIIIRSLAGDSLPSIDNGSNNQYYLNEVTPEYANHKPHMRYEDSMVYIPSLMEKESARILTTIFHDKNGRYFELVVSTPTIEKDDLREAILYWIIFLYMFLLVVIISLNILVYRRTIKPLHVLLTWLDNYKVGGNNVPLKNKTNIKEFKKLNVSLEKSMNRAEDAFEKQKQFIGNASHEIQTPVAICLNRIELLMDDDNLSEAQLIELIKTQQTLQYISKLNKSLLLLSKIDNNQFFEKHKINTNNLIKKLLIDYQDVYTHMDIHLDIKENDVFILNMNETLVTILFNNLIKNSFLHNITGGSISIEINKNSILIQNTGDGSLVNPEQIFDRFYKGSKKEESTGLGLAIVKAICDMENLKISYLYKQERHCFTISE